MNKVFIAPLLIAIFLFTGVAKATDITALNPIESLKVKSQYFKEAIEYNITLPTTYAQEKHKDKQYFIIFDLHPRSQPYLSGVHEWLSHNGGWPWLETIVVTPAKYNPEFAQLFEALIKDPSNPTMLNYFENDLLAAIDQKYRTNGFRIYSGFMSNGAIGLYTLLNRPQLFNAYMITSPTLADNFAAITTQADEKLAQLAKVDDKMRFLYLSTGKHQYEQGSLPAFNSFEQSLTEFAPKTLNWQAHINNKNNYMSQPIMTVINGIEALFDDIHTDLKPESAISTKGPEAIIAHYQMLSDKKYGFEVSAEGSLKALAKTYIDNEPQKALTIYKKTAKRYPDSAYALSSLAKAYATLGDLKLAISYQIKAVEKSKTMIEWHQNKHLEMLKEFELQLTKTNS
ncbi:MAG: esterase [Colwellia sp.]|nr:esterase [Colwellia sp.]